MCSASLSRFAALFAGEGIPPKHERGRLDKIVKKGGVKLMVFVVRTLMIFIIEDGA